ncbi:putative BTB_POZ domain-containing protein [Megavirus courdo7]|uniref:Putative BTB_POZ domain-containing protein n=1 Tax=Megavirus courdo7 TaxID=1128135 RepID=H2ECL4_9VIRU|nr:putative BTB_POZ domain-containing protein [Megavirus courdo7]
MSENIICVSLFINFILTMFSLFNDLSMSICVFVSESYILIYSLILDLELYFF